MYHLICVCLPPLLSYEIHSVWVISSSTSTYSQRLFLPYLYYFQLDLRSHQHPFLNNMKIYKLHYVQKVGGRQTNTKHSLTMSILKGISPQYYRGRTSQVALVVKNLPANAWDVMDLGLIPGSGRSPRGAHGNQLQHSCLENPRDRRAWQTVARRVSKRGTWLKWMKWNEMKCTCTHSRLKAKKANERRVQQGHL